MNIVFLDVDGVLNSESSIVFLHNETIKNGWDKYDYDKYFPANYMRNLQEIVLKSDAKIVVSSSWRVFYPDHECWFILMEQLKWYKLDTRVIGITPRINMKRGKEIRKWLEDNQHLNIENFVILDDETFDMEEFTETKVAKSNWKTGLTNEVREKALKILKCDEI